MPGVWNLKICSQKEGEKKERRASGESLRPRWRLNLPRWQVAPPASTMGEKKKKKAVKSIRAANVVSEIEAKQGNRNEDVEGKEAGKRQRKGGALCCRRG